LVEAVKVVQLIVFAPEIGAYTTDEETTFEPASVPYREFVPITYGEFTLVEAVKVVQLIVFAPEIGAYTTDEETTFDPESVPYSEVVPTT
jgi:hypothetical protein